MTALAINTRPPQDTINGLVAQLPRSDLSSSRRVVGLIAFVHRISAMFGSQAGQVRSSRSPGSRVCLSGLDRHAVRNEDCSYRNTELSAAVIAPRKRRKYVHSWKTRSENIIISAQWVFQGRGRRGCFLLLPLRQTSDVWWRIAGVELGADEDRLPYTCTCCTR